VRIKTELECELVVLSGKSIRVEGRRNVRILVLSHPIIDAGASMYWDPLLTAQKPNGEGQQGHISGAVGLQLG
jgi:hypothetical protein